MATVTRNKSGVTLYAEQVLSGAIVAGKFVRQACQRHLDDLAHGEERGLWFDEDAAQHVIDFFGHLKHSKGKWAGTPIKLEAWQQFIIGSLFGWKRADGTRRFRTAYNEVARKNGKTTILAGIGLYMAFFDGEAGADVYAAATKKDQAKICWSEAKQMVLKTEGLRRRIATFVSNLHVEETRSKFEPLGADADSMDGLNIHCAIVDELHAHKTRAMVDVIETATGARSQPMVIFITTAGTDRHSVCWDQHHYSEQILDGTVDDDAFFCYVATIDEKDDWTDPRVWIKANPNLGVSVSIDDMIEKCEKAKQMPSEQNAFMRLKLDVWTQQVSRWLTLETWDACKGDEAIAPGASCVAGLDLASTTDLTALVLETKQDDIVTLCAHFWIPEVNMLARVKRDRVPYDLWAKAGWITVTPGDVTDYEFIREHIRQLATTYRITEIGYDPYNAMQLVVELGQDGLTMVPVRQGFLSLSPPSKEFERRVIGRTIRHDGNPVLRWCVANVALETDAAQNIKPSKAKSTERIDGVAAAIIALERLMNVTDTRSVYERRGIVVLGGRDKEED
jgi:phage terminase large subunit-like protein